MAANPPMLKAVMHASAPPQIIASAVAALDDFERVPDRVGARRAGGRGGRIRSLGSGPDGYVTGSEVDDGGRNEERRYAAGPFSSRVLYSRSMTSNPPIPLPMYTPTRSALWESTWKPDWASANWVAVTANWMKRAIFLISFRSM